MCMQTSRYNIGGLNLNMVTRNATVSHIDLNALVTTTERVKGVGSETLIGAGFPDWHKGGGSDDTCRNRCTWS